LFTLASSSSDADRLAALEREVERLTREVTELRAAVGRQPASQATVAARPAPLTDPPADPSAGLRRATRAETVGRIEAFNAEVSSGAPQRPAGDWDKVFTSLGIHPPSATGPRAEPRRASREGLENLVGKYGTLALAALTILMGVGAFLGWAIRNGLIGPELRVGLGVLGAVGLALAGWRMRRGRNVRFGDILLALALAVGHVVAWGAGPRLHVVPSAVALSAAALASAALAWLAWREEQQALFNVGFGGALLAPFVTSSGRGDAMVMLGYGIIVIGGGLAAHTSRAWTKTPWVIAAGIGLYAAVGIDRLGSEAAWPLANAPSLFGLLVTALVLLLAQPPVRARLMYVALSASLVGLIAALEGSSPETPPYVLAVLTTVGALSAATHAEGGLTSALVGALVLPLGSLALALGALDDATSLAGLGTAFLWSSLSAGAALSDRDGNRATHAFTATFALGTGIACAAADRPVVFCLALSALGVAGALAWTRYALPGAGYGGLVWLAAATVRAFSLLLERAAFDYTPMLTSASAAAGAVSFAWAFASWHLSRAIPAEGLTAKELPRTVIRLFGAGVAFFWLHEELARAVSPDVSVFLLVAYYATTGVLAIYLGRVRALPLLRHLGLALAVFAALKIIAQSSGLAIGWRVGAYLLAGAFLLGVAYWYRSQSPATSLPNEALGG
jgi:uncharacterized membrane protein